MPLSTYFSRLISSLLLAFACYCFVVGSYALVERWYQPKMAIDSLAEAITRPVLLLVGGGRLVNEVRVPELARTEDTDVLPVEITISQVKIEAPIVPGKISQNHWSMADSAASVLQLGGDSLDKSLVIYAHNWPKLFGRLDKLKAGNNFELQYKDGRSESLRVLGIQKISPDRVDVLYDAPVVLYTCTGWLDKQRLVVFAERV
ncbi:MAG: hypothetical protein COU66_02835 [Candidatus Pacebacteria bacterium CG10_big_fil_rev_8_21_14_0_10_44_11]|nr:MAG: hypothetical protein COU66_02835 [Candidatus Pacebacteria bacterium CG10_big_fil_rev_8_21_14_0_10_44_11]